MDAGLLQKRAKIMDAAAQDLQPIFHLRMKERSVGQCLLDRNLLFHIPNIAKKTLNFNLIRCAVQQRTLFFRRVSIVTGMEGRCFFFSAGTDPVSAVGTCYNRKKERNKQRSHLYERTFDPDPYPRAGRTGP